MLNNPRSKLPQSKTDYFQRQLKTSFVSHFNHDKAKKKVKQKQKLEKSFLL
jgi:hypothetical protein